MRSTSSRLAAVLVGLAVLAFAPPSVAPPSFADEKPAGHPLPVNPFAGAKEGDWVSVVTTISQEKSETKGTPEEIVTTWRVTKVEGDKVTVVVEKTIGKKTEKQAPRTFSTKEPPTLEAFLEMGREKVEDVKVVDDKVTIAGREIAVKKVTFVNVDGSGARAENVLCIAEGVPGVLSLSVHDVTNGIQVHVEAAGAGSSDKTSWGKKAEELGR